MRRHLGSAAVAGVLLAWGGLPGCGGSGGGGAAAPASPGDTPAVAAHLAPGDLFSAGLPILLAHGRRLFEAPFNTLDGGGRPETTGTGVPRPRREFPQNMNRISAPDANSCAGCHNLPRTGGGGDAVADVFVMAQRFPFVNFDGGPGDLGQAHTLRQAGNQRNTLGMFGSGFVEMLSREMSRDLQGIRAAAVSAAASLGADATLDLVAKGVPFGTITAHADGTLDTSQVVGVDADLVVRPFHQKGVVVSIREFTNNAMNHHHGMQTVERFGPGADPDGDGMPDELTVEDVTAASLFQALLPVPGRVWPADAGARAAAEHGETVFSSLGCAVCHVPALRLSSRFFSEPNPFNPAGNLRPADVAAPFAVDLTADGPGPHLLPQPDGSVIVPLFSDLKRHDMGPGLDTEALVQAGVPTAQWITKKLWGFSSEPPFLHNGCATTVSEAVLAHGGEAQGSRDAFAALPVGEQAAVAEFLKTLRILPEDAAGLEVVDAPPPGAPVIGDAPTVRTHVAQADVDGGVAALQDLRAQGALLFGASFNTLDGQGRPGTTGTGLPRVPRLFPENFNRISGPDANSCAGCHNLPRMGGGGDVVTSVFVLGQRFPFVEFGNPPADGDGFQAHTLDTVANERNTLGMFGAGYVELLAREMTADLLATRAAAIAAAQSGGSDVVRDLATKGVSFGRITAHADGSVDTSAVRGVDADLVVRPFHQKGVVVSLREFTNNAMNHHHGMQTVERFGAGTDPDADGRADEISVGDVTAMTIFQAVLPVPGRVLPADPSRRAAAEKGESLFSAVGCAVCHVPALPLRDAVFSEPNPYNPPGNLRLADVAAPFRVDLTASADLPRLPRRGDGSVLVPLFSDLKRHDMGPVLDTERVVQAGVPTAQWITKKLWGFASEPPFLHHSRATLVSEAILAHGGEGQAARDAYAALPASDRACVVEFLRTLRILPEGTASLEVTSDAD